MSPSLASTFRKLACRRSRRADRRGDTVFPARRGEGDVPPPPSDSEQVLCDSDRLPANDDIVVVGEGGDNGQAPTLAAIMDDNAMVRRGDDVVVLAVDGIGDIVNSCVVVVIDTDDTLLSSEAAYWV